MPEQSFKTLKVTPLQKKHKNKNSTHAHQCGASPENSHPSPRTGIKHKITI